MFFYDTYNKCHAKTNLRLEKLLLQRLIEKPAGSLPRFNFLVSNKKEKMLGSTLKIISTTFGLSATKQFKVDHSIKKLTDQP